MRIESIGMPMVEIIRQVADNCEFTEFSALYAENILTGFIRINGRTVAVVANNGELDSSASEKAADFIRFADSFNLPVLTFCDTDGYKASKEEEKNGLAKYAAKLLYAYSEATVPKVANPAVVSIKPLYQLSPIPVFKIKFCPVKAS